MTDSSFTRVTDDSKWITEFHPGSDLIGTREIPQPCNFAFRASWEREELMARSKEEKRMAVGGRRHDGRDRQQPQCCPGREGEEWPGELGSGGQEKPASSDK